MEKGNKRAVIVGAFVFIALVIFALGVMTLGGQKSLFNRGAVINAYFDEVNGLASGNNVWFAGVKVGTVRDIGFDKSGKVKVEMIDTGIESANTNVLRMFRRKKVMIRIARMPPMTAVS